MARETSLTRTILGTINRRHLQTHVKAPNTTSFHCDTGQQTHVTFLALPLALRLPTNTESPPIPGLAPAQLTNTHTGNVRELGVLSRDLPLAPKLHLDWHVTVRQ